MPRWIKNHVFGLSFVLLLMTVIGICRFLALSAHVQANDGTVSEFSQKNDAPNDSPSLFPPKKIEFPDNVPSCDYEHKFLKVVYQKGTPLDENWQPYFPQAIYLFGYYDGWQLALGEQLKLVPTEGYYPWDDSVPLITQNYSKSLQSGPLLRGAKKGHADCLAKIELLKRTYSEAQIDDMAKAALCLSAGGFIKKKGIPASELKESTPAETGLHPVQK
ncbi:MAG: hypothetical protein FWC50_06805 [Planctomycetaceae bacterium]|nr:hypothetical protein [Planctomycetaceae bacterium]